jgi:mono/diheme cytochrome c family protein
MRIGTWLLSAGILLGTWQATLTTAAAETLLERGKYLMDGIAGCGNCHTPKFGPLKGVEFAGGFPFKEPVFDAFAANITPDKGTGIGSWTDAQLIKAIREGLRPDGSLIGPPMPFALYRGISDRDVKAMVAYIRLVKPVKNKVQKSSYRIPLPPAYGPPVGNVADTPRTDKVAYGRYLAGPAGHCVECHTPMVKGHPDFKNQLGAGGFPFKGPWGVVISSNLTPANLGSWTDAQIKNAITKGVRRDGSKLTGPMAFPYYAYINSADLDAIVAYLRTLKPIKK